MSLCDEDVRSPYCTYLLSAHNRSAWSPQTRGPAKERSPPDRHLPATAPPSKTRTAFEKAVTPAASLASGLGAASLAVAIRNLASPNPATGICVNYLFNVPTIFLAHLDREPLCRFGVANWRNGAGKTLGSARSLPWPENSLYYCTVCG